MQANVVASMLLNDEIPIETARAYYGIARTVAQLVNADIMKARLTRTVPDLSLTEDEHEGPDDE